MIIDYYIWSRTNSRHDLYVMDNIIVHEIEDVISKFASTEPSSPEPRPTPLPVPPRGALDPLPAEILGMSSGNVVSFLSLIYICTMAIAAWKMIQTHCKSFSIKAKTL